MRRQLLCLVVLGFVGFIVTTVEAEFDGRLSLIQEEDDQGVGSRKLLQEKKKSKTTLGKSVPTGVDGISQAKGSGATEEKKLQNAIEEKKATGIQGDGSQKKSAVKKSEKKITVQDEGDEKSQKKSATQKPGKEKKRALDEEDDEDIRFLEEEKRQGAVKDDEIAKEDETTEPKVSKTKESGLKKKDKAVKKSVAKKEDTRSGTEGLPKAGEEEHTELSVMEPREDKDERIVGAAEEVSPTDRKTIEEVKKEKASSSKKKKAKSDKKVPQVQVEAIEDTDASLDSVKKEELQQARDVEVIPDDFDDMKVDVKQEVPKPVPVKKETTSKPSTKSGKGGKDLSKTKPKTSKEKSPVEKSSQNATATKTKKSTYSKKKVGGKKDGSALEAPKTKPDQIHLGFPDAGAAEDVEDLHTDAGLSKTGGDGMPDLEDPELDEDINLLSEFSALPSKLQQTAGNVADTLRPGLSKLSETSKTYFSHASQQMTESFTPIMGDQVAPVVASLISYALLLIPLVVVLYMLERIRASLSLAKVLFFVNLYLGAYFLTLVLATFPLHQEPMAFFFKNSRSSCIFLQLLQAFGYMFYLLLYTVVLMKAFSFGILEKLMSGFQWVIVALFGLHYYVTVFHRAMALKVPRTTWKVYLVYTAAFSILALFARAKIEPTKKEYYYSTVDDTDEAIPVDKRS